MNYLARLSHTYEKQNLLSFTELAKEFNLEKISRAPARFDSHQLFHWQKEAMMIIDSLSVAKWLGDDTINLVPMEKRDLYLTVMKKNVLFPREAKEWALIFFGEKIEYSPEQLIILQQTSDDFFNTAIKAVQLNGIDIKAVCEEVKNKLNIQERHCLCRCALR